MQNLKKRPKIVVLDGYTTNPGDLSWTKIKALGPTTVFDHTTEEEIIDRARQAEVLIVNKVPIRKKTLDQLPHLRCICLLATGYNNIDIQAAGERGIVVCNAVGYGSASVAQHVFALLLTLTHRISDHNKSVQEGKWSAHRDFSYWLHTIPELKGSTFGIYGFGKIGQQVATIAQAFGMNILATHKHPERDKRPGVTFVPIEELFAQSDVVSLHAPLTKENEGIVNKKLLQKMKSSAILINTGRGGLVHEKDLAEILREKVIFGAALDVLSQEPPPKDHPLFGLDNCIITPHMAWAAKEARERLLDITVENISAYLHGDPRNKII
jgi:glycerate dehydrogenase